jgi:ABC-type Fe3+/spermidine/putrescine transport system ATPase subunit
MSSLALRNITKSFGGVAAVRDVGLEVASGEFFALLGPSGCGKTTLLRMIAGFESPDAGSVTVDGVDVTGLPPGEREMGMVFQNYALFPHLTVFENVAFGLRAKKRPAGEIGSAVETSLRGVGLEGKKGSPVTSLSGGEQQRVALARALILSPRILLCDEPLSNLDVALRAGMREEIRSQQRRAGVTTVYVTHDQSEAMSLADRIAIMRDGRIEQTGSPSELYDRPATPFVASFFGGANLLEGELDGAGRFRSAGVEFPVSRDPGFRGRATLAVKPEAISLRALGEDGCEGVVQSREYLGLLTSFVVRIGGTTVRSVMTGARAAAGIGDGAVVRVEIDGERCVWFRGVRP